MKVLVTYGRKPPYPPHGQHLAKAFRDLGHSAMLLPVRDQPWWETSRKRLGGFLTKHWQWDRIEWANKRLLRTAAGYRPDLIIETGGELFTPSALRTIKRRWGVRLGASLVEGPFRGDIPAVLAEYDRVVSTSQVAVEQLRHAGLPLVEYLPFATDPTWFHPRSQQSSAPLYSLAFVGAYAPRRARFLEFVSDLGLGIWGPDWDHRCPSVVLRTALRAARGVFGSSLVRCYQNSKIVLNIQREHMTTLTRSGQEVGTGLGWRHFDVPACGSLLLTEHVLELSEAFTVGEEVETFSSPEELREKTSYFLAHETQREVMIRRARERVLRDHTYLQRAQKWVEWFEQLPQH